MADAVGHPRTVVIHPQNTPVANLAVMTERWLWFPALLTPPSAVLRERDMLRVLWIHNVGWRARICKNAVEIVEQDVEYQGYPKRGVPSKRR